ncbi:MAG: hypothetical protein WDA53_09025 [Bacillota bacterium]
MKLKVFVILFCFTLSLLLVQGSFSLWKGELFIGGVITAQEIKGGEESHDVTGEEPGEEQSVTPIIIESEGSDLEGEIPQEESSLQQNIPTMESETAIELSADGDGDMEIEGCLQNDCEHETVTGPQPEKEVKVDGEPDENTIRDDQVEVVETPIAEQND